jgi:hypothetical protein
MYNFGEQAKGRVITMPNLRSAQPGDICVLLLPEPADLIDIRRRQDRLVKTFGGWIAPEVHITCQRFKSPQARSLDEQVLRLRTVLGRQPAFVVQAARLVQFEAPFWQTHVLRWEIQTTPEFSAFIEGLDAALVEIGFEPHYPHDAPFTCSALDLLNPVLLDLAPPAEYPLALFRAQRVVFSRVLGLNDFETIGYASLKE